MADFGQVGSASVALRANAKPLKKGLATARANVNSSATRMGQAFTSRFSSGMRGLGPTIAAAFSVAAIAGFLRKADQAIDKLDEIAKSADKIGITTDALQELRVAADLSGVSQGALNTGLRTFAKAIDEANQGVATYKDNFDRLGVTVTDAQGKLKPIESLIEEVADGMAGMENATTKAAIAQELFGRAGTDLINLLNTGAAGIANMREEARKLGLVFEEDLIRKSVIAKDELTLLRRVVDAELTVAMAKLAPVLLNIAQLLAAIVTAAANAAEGFRRLAAGEIFKGTTQRLQDELSDASSALAKLDADTKAFSETGAVSPFLQFGAGVEPEGLIFSGDSFDDALNKIAVKREEIIGEIGRLQNDLREASAEDLPPILPPILPPVLPPRLGTGSGTAEAASQFDALSEAIQRTIDKEREEQSLAAQTASTLGLSESAREALIVKIKAEQVERALLAEIADEGNNLSETEAAQLRMLAAELKRVTIARAADERSLQDQEEALREAERANQIYINGLTSVVGTIDQAIQAGDSFLDVLLAIAQQIVNMPQFQQALFDAGSGGKSGGAGGGIFESLLGGIAGAFAGGGKAGGTATKGFADGGVPPLGSFSLVGERGTELQMFDTPSRIFSNDDLRELVGGGTTNINQTLQFLDAKGAKEAAGSIARRTAEQTQRGVRYL